MRSSFISSFAAFTGLALATPSIVVVPGAWQISPSWTPFINLLKGAGYETSLVTLPSVGISLTGLDVDVAAAQAVIDPLLDAGKEVVVLCHSLGGLIAANSVGNRSIAARSAAGSPGGVVQLIYLAAFMAPEGYSLYNLMGNAWFEWMEVANGEVTGNATQMYNIGFNDMTTAEADVYMSYMTWTSEQVFTDAAVYAPWADTEGVTEAYIHTLLDNALPYASQLEMAAMLPSAAAIYEINSSHVPFISQPATLLPIVEDAIAVGVTAAASYVKT